MAVAVQAKTTIEEFLDRANRVETKPESYDVRIVVLTGGTVGHGRWAGRLREHLVSRFETHPRKTFFERKGYIAKPNAFAFGA